MSNGTDINAFVKDPSLLVKLCRELIDELVEDSGNKDIEKIEEKESQLREISRAIERLEKAGVAVPDSLRAEKTRLAASLGVQPKAYQALSCFADELEEIIKELKYRLGRSVPSQLHRKSQGKRSTSPKTGQEILREHIIKALKKLGGRARSSDVIKQIGHQLEGKLLPGDMEWRKSANAYAWQHNVHWERYRMTQDGELRSDSERGYWELNEDQR
jgi:hypothetical protein